ncbi:hypothetical protein B5S32_g4070 [[Candida] boidinii]|nr:hypothetical protein B5S32_g4070 [[Candida] boidinii]
MSKYKLFGDNAILTPLAQWIMDENIEKLEEELKSGNFKINDEFEVTKYIDETPLTLCLYANKRKVLDWLLEHKVDLNDSKNPGINMACSSSDIDIVERLIDMGMRFQNTNSERNQESGDEEDDDNSVYTGENLKSIDQCISKAIYGDRIDVINLLIRKGYDIKKNGKILRQAVFNKQYEIIDILIDNGIDVNFCIPDMVFPYNSTPVHIATSKNDIELVKKLVNKGANVLIKDEYGCRPFTCAYENNFSELIDYLRSIEPNYLHDKDYLVTELKKKNYTLPKKLMEIIYNKNNDVESLTYKTKDENEFVNIIRFHSIITIKEIKFNNLLFLDLLSYTDDYDNCGFFCWNQRENCLCHLDFEMDECVNLCTFDEFDSCLDDLDATIDKIFQ